jgi:two-component system phosphate regulon sensor histidine kinase PhoR
VRPGSPHLSRAIVVAAVLAAVVLWTPSAFAAALVVIAVLLLAGIAAAEEPRPEAEIEELAEPAAIEFAHLIEPLAEGVLLLDERRAVVAVNAAAARILGRPTEVMLGSSLIVALRDHDLAEIVRAATGVPTSVHVSSSAHDVVATASAVEAGPVRTLLVLEDVTELARARRARADLVANMSHELRTPVAAARAIAETLQAGVDEPEEAARFHDRLVEEIGRLGAMVDRLLRLSRLESGSEHMAVEALRPADLLRTAAERIEPLVEARGAHIEWACEEELPAVAGDQARVLEVLSNLLDNAAKFAPQGSAVQAWAERDTSGLVRFEVRDAGPGILPAERARVFERFYTGDRARGSGGGTGLGLAIARHIIERLGGRIWVADRSPGTTICFTLPTAAPEGDTSAADDASALADEAAGEA